MSFDATPQSVKSALVADLFCGAGGSSTGARRALARLGYRMNLVAVNHWPVAIETHQRNHPGARHFCQDVNAAKPADLVPEGKLDLLMASPTCTFHSRARGAKPINDQGRMDPWAIVHWATELRVKRILVENVPEFVEWGPLDLRTGRPIKRRKGEYFRAWLKAFEAIGFRAGWRILNAADFGDATTRERFFLMARSDGRRIRWPEPTHSRDGIDLLGQRVRKWRAAREIIDWSVEGRSIFDRRRPLAPKTLARIYAGAVKFRWPEPFLVVLRQHMDAQSLDAPLPTVCAGGTHIGLAEPFLLNRHGDHNGGARVRPLEAPMTTATGSGAGYLVEPFILSQASGGAPRAVAEPVPTIPTGGAHALIAPYYGSGSGKSCRNAECPLPTVTTRDRFGLVMPVTHCDGSNRARSVDDPLPIVTTAARGELAFITAAFGARVHDIAEPAPTICAQGRIQLVDPVADRRRYDIRFRMLEPRELARAMGFKDEETEYEFVGTKTEIVKQIGNAVCVNIAAALVTALFKT